MDPLLATLISYPLPGAKSFGMLLPGNPVTVTHFVVSSKATRSLITIPTSSRAANYQQCEQTAHKEPHTGMTAAIHLSLRSLLE
ncbi:hypothetical protein BTVI_140665 [Pitangus sulphuratus]|nr:hypothetical protein BTVI_140665 [Pitangus sulphuratus]